jgi:hypothetical protein
MPISYNRVEIDVDLALALIAQGLPWKVVTKALGASRQTVLTRLKEAGHEQPLRTPGRPRAITGELGDVIRAKSLAGMSDHAIARAVGLAQGTVSRWLTADNPERKLKWADRPIGVSTYGEVVAQRRARLPLLAIAEAAGVKVWTICSILRRYAPDTIHRRPESAKAARKRRRLASKRG